MPSSAPNAARSDPFGFAALALAGMLGAHQLGYLAESTGVVSHAHLSVVGPAALLALSAAGWIAALRVIRADVSSSAPSLASLAGAQVVLFAAMEVGEHLIAGAPEGLWSLPVLLGAVLQPVIAWLALRLLDVGQTLLRAIFCDDAGRFFPLASNRLAVAPIRIDDRSSVELCPPRGPPVS